MFIPTTIDEIKSLGWDRLDIILVSGDTYIDSSYMGFVVIGRVLMDRGFRVGIIAQPDVKSESDITRLGEPLLFWGISSGSVDSMVSNYTATGKKRKKDDLTPGGINNRRPDRALIFYTNMIRRYFKGTVPIVLGGIEASLRRIVHYDYMSNSIRRSILFDSKADYLIYGMGEKAVIELAYNLKNGEDIFNIRGLCYISKSNKDSYLELPSFEKSAGNKFDFLSMHKLFYKNNDPLTASGMVQKHADRFLIHNPPAFPLTTEELDNVFNLPYKRDVHPFYKKNGHVRALDTIRFSISTHRGCFGECNFCSIAVHQGRRVLSRSEKSIIKEAKEIATHREFKGNISDVGGPSGNMFGFHCSKMDNHGWCDDKRCLVPEVCKSLNINHNRQIKLLESICKIPGIKKIFVSSGIRYDLVLSDEKNGLSYLMNLMKNHISGQMKIAPEHVDDKILELMGKPDSFILEKFIKLFKKNKAKLDKGIFLTYYFIAAHPGCNVREMKVLKNFNKKILNLIPEQVQIFTPTPSTHSTLMYYTGINPFTGEGIFVEKNKLRKEVQKKIIVLKK